MEQRGKIHSEWKIYVLCVCLDLLRETNFQTFQIKRAVEQLVCLTCSQSIALALVQDVLKERWSDECPELRERIETKQKTSTQMYSQKFQR